jgi:hypothetical protein
MGEYNIWYPPQGNTHIIALATRRPAAASPFGHFKTKRRRRQRSGIYFYCDIARRPSVRPSELGEATAHADHITHKKGGEEEAEREREMDGCCLERDSL